LVPLLMALKIDPVRLLIADDVGIGKTIEASLVARELLDRGEADRLAVLCPPHLTDQWQSELRGKFHIKAERVLPSTVTRLERRCAVGQSLFDVYPFVIVSTDFIKSDRRRNEFLRTCPELVIVDEAHTCAYGQEQRGRHQRFKVVRGLADDASRHLILVTATPHSGKEEAFRSLLALVDRTFEQLPEDLSGPANEQHRRRLAQNFVQRRRADIRQFMDEDTPFPDREEREDNYSLSPEYKKLFQRALEYARETVIDPEGGKHRQRVRWWSALALLRSLASSPAAAAATLRTRAITADALEEDDVEELGRRSVLDVEIEDTEEGIDVVPGSDAGDDGEGGKIHRRLLDMARTAESLVGNNDEKLVKAAALIDELLREGFSPIVFCRFIPTADYVAEELRKRLTVEAEVISVTGTLPPDEREHRVNELTKNFSRVLVCTDCLSEGINLQEHFDAVFHYDLSWNPTRHEQREGRVDRYGQEASEVRVLTYYGIDNQIDGIVLDVLIRKHKRIRKSTGISVPVPANSDSVVEAIFEGILLREQTGATQDYLPGLEEFLKPKKEDLYAEWDNATEREKRSRTMFAQASIKPEEVKRELEATREAIGSGSVVQSFTQDALQAHGAVVSSRDGVVEFDLRETPRALKEAIGNVDSLKGGFRWPVGDDVVYLSRTHPFVEGLASHVMDTALDPVVASVAKRAGAIRTKRVAQRTTVLLVRFRFHINTRRGGIERQLLAEECRALAFQGAPSRAEWLDSQVADELLGAEPDANILPEQAHSFVSRIVQEFEGLRPSLNEAAQRRGEELLTAHERVRKASGQKHAAYSVEPKDPDVLGIYVYLPAETPQ
jgi:superfamily II DNA or RNA helicase